MRLALIGVHLLWYGAALYSQTLPPEEALSRFLATSTTQGTAWVEAALEMKVDAARPRLHKQGSMSGLKLVSLTQPARDMVFVRTRIASARWARPDARRHGRSTRPQEELNDACKETNRRYL